MSILGCVLAASSMLTGLAAPKPDNSVKVFPTVKIHGKTPTPLIRKLPFNVHAVGRISHSLLNEVVLKSGSASGNGITDMLHLDARTPYVAGKGNLSVGRCSTDLDLNYIAFDIEQGGGVTVTFEAISSPAHYFIDMQVNCGPKPVNISATIDGVYQSGTVDSSNKHLLFALDCTGGTHKIVVYCTLPCIILITGVDIFKS